MQVGLNIYVNKKIKKKIKTFNFDTKMILAQWGINAGRRWLIDLAVKGAIELLFSLFHVPSKNFTAKLSCLVTSSLDLKHNSIHLSKFNL
jgi:hypothetical protein